MRIRRLFFDIETSPNVGLFWKPGVKISIGHENIIQERAIICIAYKWDGEKKTNCLTWDKNRDDKKMLQEFVKVLETADELCGHNLKNYDTKWVRTRCLVHGIPFPPKLVQEDTLKIARTLFAFNSNRLDYIAKFLGEEGKIKTSFDMWKKILLDNDQKELARMVAYCRKDVLELEKVYNHLKNYAPPATHVGVQHGKGKCSCPECGSLNHIVSKTRYSATGAATKQLKCKDCFKYFSVSERAYLTKS